MVGNVQTAPVPVAVAMDMKEDELPTHVITSCKGNIMGTVLIMVVMDLKTQELTEIKL